MDVGADAAQLVIDAMALPLPVFIGLASAWGPVLVLLHELGHATVALDLTSGRVSLFVGRQRRAVRFSVGRLDFGLSPAGPGGLCVYEPATLKHRRAEVWIAAAGPITSALTGFVLLLLALMANGFAAKVLTIGALGAVLETFISGLPLRYAQGLGGGESDGRAVWRILRGAPPGGIDADLREPRPIRPLFAAVLAAVGVLSLFVSRFSP